MLESALNFFGAMVDPNELVYAKPEVIIIFILLTGADYVKK